MLHCEFIIIPNCTHLEVFDLFRHTLLYPECPQYSAIKWHKMTLHDLDDPYMLRWNFFRQVWSEPHDDKIKPRLVNYVSMITATKCFLLRQYYWPSTLQVNEVKSNFKIAPRVRHPRRTTVWEILNEPRDTDDWYFVHQMSLEDRILLWFRSRHPKVCKKVHRL